MNGGALAGRLAFAVSASALMLSSIGATAQSYPTRPVRLIVPFASGGASDVLGRILAQKLTERMGQQVLVENRPGAGGSIGTEAAIRAAPDGYTLLLGSVSEIAINPWLYSKLGYDTMKGFTPVAMFALSQMVITTHPSLPVKTVKDLIALAKARPGEINYGSSGSGTFLHLATELFRSETNTNMTHIAYKSGGQALVGLVSGEVQVMFGTLTSSMPFIKGKRVRPIAVSSRTRAASLPDVPTIAESGLPGYEVSSFWVGVFAPAATPRDVVTRLANETAQSARLPDVMSTLASLGAEPGTLTQQQFADFLKAELALWGRAVKTSGAKAE